MLKLFFILCAVGVLLLYWASTDLLLTCKRFVSLTSKPIKLSYTSKEAKQIKEHDDNDLDWQELLDIGGKIMANNSKIFVYSAYRDFYENIDVIRVIAVTLSFSKQKLYCSILDENKLLLATVSGKTHTTLCPQNKLMYSAAFINCQLDRLLHSYSALDKNKILTNFKYVSIHLNPSYVESSFKLIKIRNDNEEPEKHHFAACVQPTFSYDNVLQFVQWLEYQKMMGVTHFTFYNISIGPKVSCIMESKAVNDVTPVVVLKWTTPIRSWDLLHVNGQIAQINDCAFRYRGVSKYLVYVDFDEYIVPHPDYSTNYFDLISLVNDQFQLRNFSVQPVIAQYQFRGAFFSEGFNKMGRPDAEIQSSKKFEIEDILTYRYISRDKDLFPPKIRSKFITIPKNVIEPGVHSIDESVNNAVELEILEEIAYMHHYRTLGCHENCSKMTQVIDKKAQFYSLQLLHRVQTLLANLKRECSFKEISELRLHAV